MKRFNGIHASKAYRTSPRPCRACGQMMSREYLEARYEKTRAAKSAKIKAAMRERQARGEVVGSAKKIDRAPIIALLKAGTPRRRAAEIVGCSIAVVHRTAQELSK